MTILRCHRLRGTKVGPTNTAQESVCVPCPSLQTLKDLMMALRRRLPLLGVTALELPTPLEVQLILVDFGTVIFALILVSYLD